MRYHTRCKRYKIKSIRGYISPYKSTISEWFVAVIISENNGFHGKSWLYWFLLRNRYHQKDCRIVCLTNIYTAQTEASLKISVLSSQNLGRKMKQAAGRIVM